VKRILLIFIVFYSGCTPMLQNMANNEINCNKEVKPNTLLFLEQQYRCKSYN